MWSAEEVKIAFISVCHSPESRGAWRHAKALGTMALFYLAGFL